MAGFAPIAAGSPAALLPPNTVFGDATQPAVGFDQTITNVIGNLNQAVATSNAVASGVAGGGGGVSAPVANAQAGVEDLNALWNASTPTAGGGGVPVAAAAPVAGATAVVNAPADDDLTNVWNAGTPVSGGGGVPVSAAPVGGTVTNAPADDDLTNIWNAGTPVSGGGPASAPVASSWAPDVSNVWTGSAPGTVIGSPDDVSNLWLAGGGFGGGGGGGGGAYGAPAAVAGGGATGTVNAAAGGQSQANRELLPLLNVLGRSATGTSIVNALRQTDIKIDLVDTATFRQTHDAATLAVFDSGTNTITLQRDQVLANPQRAALTFAHEATHALDDARIDGAIRAAQVSARSTANPAEAFAQGEFEVHMAAEARAYRNEAQTAIDLGLDPRYSLGLTPAVDPATGGVRDFATTWRAVAASRGYNPAGRTGTPRDFAA